jgi:asparagine synthase (glutamine-hydrolysing)
MIRTLSRRGPDERGCHVNGVIGFAHARLSIIDVAAGQQLMSNEDATLWVTFNGEIFNYIELRDQLEQKGHRFATSWALVP